MRIALASMALVFSAALFAWFAAIFLYPIYLVGWEQGSHIHREWHELIAAAAIGTTATLLLVMGMAILMSRRTPPTNT